MAGKQPVRVALLLPVGSEDEAIRHMAKGMRHSAELALFQINLPNLLMIVEDTKGTAQGAERAARRAIDQGAEIILGPLFSGSVNAVSPLARQKNIPVVAFSTERAVAGNGVFLLSFQVEEEVRRVVEFAMQQEMTGFAALVPDNAYGAKVATTLEAQSYLYNAEIRHMVKYDPYADDLRADVKTIAEYGQRRTALESQVTVLNDMDDDQAALRALERLKDTDGYGLVSYQAVLLPAGGSKLRRIAPLLPYYDIDNKNVKYLGTGLWDDPSLWSEPSLQGGWFAAPTPEVRGIFNQLFESNFGYQPPRLASLAYDAVTLAAALSVDGRAGQRFTAQRIVDPSGFTGIDGLFRFLPTGGAERGLAILEVRKGGVKVVGPAPTSFSAAPQIDPFASPDGRYRRSSDGRYRRQPTAGDTVSDPYGNRAGF
jgi:ABC-type branched-subunit amino acid transport system substrate-binding protein